jgi:hypothetical protein
MWSLSVTSRMRTLDISALLLQSFLVSSGRPGITSYVAFRHQIDRLATLEHVDESRQLTGSCLGVPCLVQAMEDGVAVDAVEGGEEAGGILVGVQCRLEVARELGVTLQSIGGSCRWRGPARCRQDRQVYRIKK